MRELKIGRKFALQGKNKNYVSVFIQTDWNDGDYVSTLNEYSYLSVEQEAYLWLLQNVINLRKDGYGIDEFLAEHGEGLYNDDDLKKHCFSYAEMISDWLVDVLDMPFADNAPYSLGHTLDELKVTIFEDGEIYSVDFRDEELRMGRVVAAELIKMVNKEFLGSNRKGF